MQAFIHLNQIATLASAHQKDGRMLLPSDISIIDDGAVVFDNDKILWVGRTQDIPQEYQKITTNNLKDHVLTPELVDSHTHLIFGGDRALEYIERLNGTSYQEIASRGGGILFTMKETQNSSDETLLVSAKKRIEQLISYGIGTIEIKSGYGLNYQEEKRLSLIIHELKETFAPRVQIFNTYLAAHDVPKDFASSSEYLNQVVIPLLKELAFLKVIDAVDIFYEVNYFSESDTRKLFQVAQELGIPRKIHADELNTNGGAELACEFNALSADHLLKISDDGIKNLSSSQTVATLLPGTAFFLGKPLAPAQTMLNAGVKVALASDYNPGSCHCDNLLLIASISAAQLKMNVAQLWCGITLNASHALGLKDQGAIIPGLKPRFSVFKAPSLAHISYNWGKNFAVTI